MQNGGGGKYSITQMSSGGDGYASTYLHYRLDKNGRGLKQTYVLVTSCEFLTETFQGNSGLWVE